jgi:hypothetical protein
LNIADIWDCYHEDPTPSFHRTLLLIPIDWFNGILRAFISYSIAEATMVEEAERSDNSAD